MPRGTTVREFIERGNRNDTSALYLAAAHGHVEVARLLLSCGAHVDHGKSSGATPLFAAAYKGHADMIEALLAAGADPCLRRGESSPLWIAAMYVAAHGSCATVWLDSA